MSKSAETSTLPQPHNVDARVSVKRIASAAAELSKRHTAQFANLAALARTVQTYMPVSKVNLDDYAQLARTLIDCAEQYEQQADMEDIAFSIIATDTQFLLNDEARAAFLGRCPRSAKAKHVATDSEARPAKKRKAVKRSAARPRKPMCGKTGEPIAATAR
jgi:hypothetical protein